MKRSKSQRSLRTFVNRVLAWRLALVGIALSILLGLMVLARDHWTVGEIVLQFALQRAELFNAHTHHILDGPEFPEPGVLQEQLDSFSGTGRQSDIGRFVFVNLYDLSLTRMAGRIQDPYEHIEDIRAYMGSEKRLFPALGESQHRVERFGDEPHVLLVAPLVNSLNKQIGFIEGVFALSPQTVADMRRSTVESMLAVMGIVLVTTAMLYPVIITLTRKLATFSSDLLDSNLDTLQVLGSAVAKRDSDTSAHNLRVTIIAVRAGEALHLEPHVLQGLIKGAFLHDVGKIGIHDEILLKPGRLTDEEFEVMQTHVRHGVDIVKRSGWLRDAMDVVRYHHEKFDGTGYLAGLSGEAIPMTARIFAISDVFDALTARRPYKEPFSLEKSLEILREGRGTHFDPHVHDVFAGLAPSFFERLAGREDEGLQEELQAIIGRYFSGGLDVLTI